MFDLMFGGGGGNSTLGGPCRLTPVFRTGDFRNSSTPPHGAPPRIRTAHAEFAARPLAICCCGAWRPGGDSNTQSRVWNPLASPSATGTYWCARPDLNQHCTAFEAAASAVGLRAHGRLGRIRTDTGRGLSAPPLPGWATSLWCSGRDSNSQQCGSRPHASTSCATRTLVGSRGSEPRRSRWDTGSTARRSQPLSQLPKRELSKTWRKADDSNAYVPRDPGLANQWDTNYPSLPGKNYNLDLEEITDLVRDTKTARL